MMQNVDTLPESSQGLIAQLEGLRQRERTISGRQGKFDYRKRSLETTAFASLTVRDG
jgi:hypothetical protein